MTRRRRLAVALVRALIAVDAGTLGLVPACRLVDGDRGRRLVRWATRREVLR